MNQERIKSEGPAELEPPPVVPNFTLFHCIGGGAYGKVWLARDAIGQWRAVKTVYRNRFGDNERAYLRELAAIKRYAPISSRHENLLRIFYVGPEDTEKYFFYVMELADSQDGSFEPARYQSKTLESLLRRVEHLPPAECVAIGLGLATALDELHRCGLVHRDIKPSNIIFVEGKPKLADIGLVGVLGEAGSQVGTIGFIPPEGPGNKTADVYALGKVLYTASTGFEPGKFPEPPIEILTSDKSKQWLELNVVLVKACELDARRRYQDAAHLRRDLLLLEAKTSLLERQRWGQRRALLKKYGIGVAVVFLALLAAVIMYRGRADEQEMARRLHEAEIERLGKRSTDWSRRHAERLRQAARVRLDKDLLDEAGVAMAGMDMRMTDKLRGVGASSVAFGPHGEVLFGGTEDSVAHVYFPADRRFEELAQKGSGPVGFDKQGRMLQFVALDSHKFAVRDLRNGEHCRSFSLPAKLEVSSRRPILGSTPELSTVAVAGELASGGYVEVWATESGIQLGHLDEVVTVLAFSPDGRYLATGHKTGEVKLWTVPGLQRVRSFQMGHLEVHALAFGRDALVTDSSKPDELPWILAAGDAGADIKIYHLTTGDASEYRGSAYDVRTLAFRGDGAVLASGGREKLRLWDVATGEQILETASDTEADYLGACAFAPDGLNLAIAAESSSHIRGLSIWEIEEGRGVQVLYGLGSPAESVWWAPDGRQVAALSQRWELAVWTLPDGRLSHLLQVHQGDSQDNAAVAFDSTDEKLAFSSYTEVRTYDLRRRYLTRNWAVPAGYCDSLKFEGQGPSERLLLLHSETDERLGTYHRWALRDLYAKPEVPIRQELDTNWATYATALPQGKSFFLVGGGPRSLSCSSIIVIALDDGRVVGRADIADLPYNRCVMALDPSGTFLAFATKGDASAGVLWLTTGQFMKQLDRMPTAIGPGTNWFVRLCDPSGWALYPAGNWDEKGSIKFGADFRPMRAPKFSPDGSRLAIPTAEGRVLVANLETVQENVRKWGWAPKGSRGM